jgi:superfamily II DNA or RNA helicase
LSHPKVIDNRRRTLLSVLKELAPDFDELSIATGYWDLKGMAALMPYIREYKKVRIIIGQEPIRARFQIALDNEPVSDFPEEDLKWDLTHSEYEQILVDTASELENLIKSGNIEVKVYRGAFLHAKAYIFSNSTNSTAIGIIGSSNFTGAGLESNTELNALEDESRIVKYKPETAEDEHGHLSWYEEIWNDKLAELWSGEFAKIISESPLGRKCFSPYEMYMKTLWELYGEDADISTTLSTGTGANLFAFQQRNARLLIQKLKKYGVAMLADSVGLGKTITAGAVIKEYIATLKARRIYIIVPAALVQSWKRDLAKVLNLVSGFEIISMQDYNEIERAREIDKYADVDLFIVDEAHNLRNPNGTRHEQLLEWFSNNSSSHVLMLTATPINNKLTDFVNQIQLGSKGKLDTFPVVYPTSKKREVIDFFEAVKRLTADMQASENSGEKIDYTRVSRIMRQGLRHFLVRTTRRGIEAEFGGLLSEDGTLLKFPKSKVETYPYSFSPKLSVQVDKAIELNKEVFEGKDPRLINLESLLSQTQRTRHPLDLSVEASEHQKSEVFEKIFRLILLLGFAPYKTHTYLNQYYGKTVTELREFDIPPTESFKLRTQMSVHNIMRVTFLKRLESSQAALQNSLVAYSRRLDKFEKYLSDGYVASLRDINEIEKEFGEDSESWTDDQVKDALDIELIPVSENKHNVSQLKADIKRDRAIIKTIQSCCAVLDNHDDKLFALVRLIKKLRQEGGNGKKILLFSYFADTVRYLERQLPELIKDKEFSSRSAYLSGSNRKNLETIVKKFSPKSTNSEIPEDEEINFLFSTDVLSEGQNLQDCGILVNYDLHWNPVRMIQRNGRINRLGSPFESIAVYNLAPETVLDSYLKLVNRLERKIDAIRFTIGTDQSVLGELENPIEFLDGLEEDENLNEILNMYKLQDSSQILDKYDDDDELLSEDEFIIELRRFLSVASEEQIQRVKGIPSGKWGYLPISTKLSKNRILALNKISGFIDSTGQELNSHIFIESDADSNYMVDPLDIVAALGYIKCAESDSEARFDNIVFNRKFVKKLAEASSREVVKEYGLAIRITPVKKRVLDALEKTIRGLGLSLVLRNISTKQQLKRVERLFINANSDLKTHGQFLPSTIDSLVTLQKDLADAKPEARVISSVESVLFYVS